jgi:hypothetical protein
LGVTHHYYRPVAAIDGDLTCDLIARGSLFSLVRNEQGEGMHLADIVRHYHVGCA